MRQPGTLSGDRAHYSGRTLIGFTRASPGGILAFDADGKIVGTFANEKAAASAFVQLRQSTGGP